MQYTSIPDIDPRADDRPVPIGPRTARCADLASLVGHLDLDDDLLTGSLLSVALNEFAAGTGRRWRFDPATSPALLLRALSKLSVQAPDAHSSSARVLLDAHRVSVRGAA